MGGSTGGRRQVVVSLRVERSASSVGRLIRSGRPDFVFLKQRLAVFMDGCFWHACPKHSNVPANNRAFWFKKLTGNRSRDRVVNRTLRSEGWRVVRIWEHELTQNPHRCIARIKTLLEAKPSR